jgi:hypothetical protein
MIVVYKDIQLQINSKLNNSQLAKILELTLQKRTGQQIAEQLSCTCKEIESTRRAIARAIPKRDVTNRDRQQIKTLTNAGFPSVVQAILLGLNLTTIKMIRQELGVAARVKTVHHWTSAEDQYLITNYKSTKCKEIADTLHKPQEQVTIRAKQLGLIGTKDAPVRRGGWYTTYEDRCKKLGKWTDEQIAYVRANAEKLTMRQLVDAINGLGAAHKWHSVRDMVTHYGLTTVNQIKRGRAYTDAERQFMLNNWQRLSVHELAALMADDITPEKVRNFLQQHGATKNRLSHTLPEYIAMAMLDAHNVPFTAFARVKCRYPNGSVRQREVDLLVDNKLAVEVQGDYWHGNPRKFKRLNNVQRRRQRDDAWKRQALEEQGYTYLELWEDDLVRFPIKAEQCLCAAVAKVHAHGDKLNEVVYVDSQQLMAKAKQEYERSKRRWIDRDVDVQMLLTEVDHGKTIREVASALNVTMAEVQRTLSVHGRRKKYTKPLVSLNSKVPYETQLMRRGWTAAQLDCVQRMMTSHTPTQIATMVNQPVKHVQTLLAHYGITSCVNVDKVGRQINIKKLSNWQHVDAQTLADDVNVSVPTLVMMLRHTLGVDPRWVIINGPRRCMTALLQAHNIQFTLSMQFLSTVSGQRVYAVLDVVVNDKLVISVYRDGKHGNPARYPVPTDAQRKQQRVDKQLHDALVANGYKHLVVWGNDLVFTPEKVELMVCEWLATHGVRVVNADQLLYTTTGIPYKPADVAPQYAVTEDRHVQAVGDRELTNAKHMHRGKWPASTLAAIRKWAMTRQKYGVVMHQLGMTFSQLVHALTCAGLEYAPRGGVLSTVEDVDTLLACVAKGMTNSDIAVQLNTTRKRVATRLDELGLRSTCKR